jgi:small subunit ribosomal protein S21
VECVTNVVAGGNESFESLLRRFTRKVQQDGILSEIRHREYFEKKSIKRKRKAAAKRRKSTRIKSAFSFKSVELKWKRL